MFSQRIFCYYAVSIGWRLQFNKYELVHSREYLTVNLSAKLSSFSSRMSPWPIGTSSSLLYSNHYYPEGIMGEMDSQGNVVCVNERVDDDSSR